MIYTYQKSARSIPNEIAPVLRLSPETEDDGGRLEITLAGELLQEVIFDLLVDNKMKEELVDALASYSFYPTRIYYSKLRIAHTEQSKIYSFGYEDLEFVNTLEQFGIPRQLALRTTYYSLYGRMEAPRRLEIFEAFKASQKPVRLEHSYPFSGFTTVESYMAYASQYSIEFANLITEIGGGSPIRMAAATKRMDGFLDHGVQLELLTVAQLNALSSITAGNFLDTTTQPRDFNEGVRYKGIKIRALTDFVKKPHDFSEAARLMKDYAIDTAQNQKRRVVREFLTRELCEALQVYPTFKENATALASIFEACYGWEFLGETIPLFRSKLKGPIDKTSPYLFPALVAYLDYMAGGGDKDTELLWVVALEPTIDESNLTGRGNADEIR